jgi:hypothetical protein
MFPAVHGVLASQAKVTPWWLEGGIAAAFVVVAYQPKGAGSLPESYVNLANPGTFDAAPGVAPTHSAATGWTFNGTTQHLRTGVRLFQPYTTIIRYDNATSPAAGRYMLGILSTSPSTIVYHIEFNSVTTLNYGNGNVSVSVSVGDSTSGTAALAGNSIYFNGGLIPQSTLPTSWAYDPDPTGGCFIASRNFGGSPNNFFAGNILALAIYSATLTAPQVAAVSAAMAAL